MLVAIERVHLVGRLVQPPDLHVAGPEHLAQLVADEVDDGLEVELGRHALLDAVDDRELVRALLDQRVGRLQLGRALGDLLLESLRPLRVVERDRRLAREHREEVAVGVVEAAERAVEVRVQVAHQRVARDQRRDDARPLRELRRAFGRVHEARDARARDVGQRGRDVLHDLRRVLAFRHQRTRELRPGGRLEHQQHAFRAGDLGGLVDQELLQLVARAQRVHAQARVDEPLEGLLQARR